jgi:hypothetical protein
LVALVTAGLVGLVLIPEARTEMVQEDLPRLKDRVRPHIEKGVAFLKSIGKNGSFTSEVPAGATQSVIDVGATALAGVALLECDVPPNDPTVVRAADYVRSHVTASGFNYNYSVTLSIMFLDRLKRTTGKTTDDKLIKQLTTMVVQGQQRDGGWTYNLVPNAGGSDPSNSQFAVVALWMARKYGVHGVEDAMARAAQKFRNTQQQKDGGWAYATNLGIAVDSTGAMTCAGCLAIALHAGIMQQAAFRGPDNSSGEVGDMVKKVSDDPAIAKARGFLAQRLVIQKGQDSGFEPAVYWLWSLDRLCMLLNWKTINEVDWFAIGVNYLLPLQQRNGSWDMNKYGPAVNTSFALLFLARSNLLGDLFESKFTGGQSLTGTGPTTPAPVTKAEKAMPKPVVLAKDLAKKLIEARPEERPAILEEFELAKSSDYSYELAKAIPELSTKFAKDAARDVLAKRMAHRTVAIIGEYLKEDDQELRLAATRGAGVKNDKEATSLLIPLLEDRNVSVSDAALDSLKAITGQNHGKSIARWSRWYEMQKK